MLDSRLIYQYIYIYHSGHHIEMTSPPLDTYHDIIRMMKIGTHTHEFEVYTLSPRVHAWTIYLYLSIYIYIWFERKNKCSSEHFFDVLVSTRRVASAIAEYIYIYIYRFHRSRQSVHASDSGLIGSPFASHRPCQCHVLSQLTFWPDYFLNKNHFSREYQMMWNIWNEILSVENADIWIETHADRQTDRQRQHVDLTFSMLVCRIDCMIDQW